MVGVFLDTSFDAIDQGTFNRCSDKVGFRLAGREQEVEKFKGRSLRVEYQSDAFGRDRAAQVNLDEPLVWTGLWIGHPAGRWIAVNGQTSGVEVGSRVADAAAEVVQIAHGVDPLLDFCELDLTGRGQFHRAQRQIPPLTPIACRVVAYLVGC